MPAGIIARNADRQKKVPVHRTDVTHYHRMRPESDAPLPFAYISKLTRALLCCISHTNDAGPLAEQLFTANTNSSCLQGSSFDYGLSSMKPVCLANKRIESKEKADQAHGSCSASVLV